MLKIATILPYKENYSKAKAAAASLWVGDFFKYSNFKKNNFIFGSTDQTDYLSKNYININIKSSTSKFSSTTKKYCDELIKKIKFKNYDLIEIHNRPLVFNILKKEIDSKFIIYFHNDPLSMHGSKNVKERLKLLDTVEKIVFVSEWVQKRFFLNLDKRLLNKTEVIYPSINKQKKFNKKEKKIVFVGKLNPSKGYDLYKDAITKILNKFPDWKAYSIGDELRNKPVIYHSNHIELGYLPHKQVLKILSKTEIAVVPSKWEEPFGRTALEASSRGCATIISNRGGLPETSDHCLVLENLSTNNLYDKIKFLIENKKERNSYQLNGFKNVKHVTKENSKLIDDVRQSLFINYKISLIKNKLKIINIYNLGQKLNHRLYNISVGKKFTNGFIRNGHDVLEVSDRDYIKQNRSFSLINVNSMFQNFLIETYRNYKPDLIFFGHTNNINLDTFQKFKEINKKIIINQWNEDPIMKSLKDARSNIEKISYYASVVDHNFITTDPNILTKQNKDLKNIHFLFIPVDKNIERFEVYNLKPRKDIFYAMSHGVNRGILKEGKIDNRIYFLDKLVSKINGVNYDFYGFKNKEPIWGDNFYIALTNSKMGLNLSRGLPTKYYSSNRIASLMGNGLLTFIDLKTKFNDIFKQDEIIFYTHLDDLADKIVFYKNNSKARKKIAKKGKIKYFKLFNETKITKYIIDKSLGKDVKLF